MIKKVGCIGIAVKDATATAEAYVKFLGAKKEAEYELLNVGIAKAVVLRLGNVFIEIMQPSEMDSPIKKFVDTRGEGLFQIAVLSDNIEAEIQNLERKGARVSKMVIDKEKDLVSGYISPKSLSGVVVEITSDQVWPYNVLPPLT